MEAVTRSLKRFTEIAQEYIETLYILLFIINGLATFLILFDKIEVGQNAKQIVGALSFGFAAVMFITFTNRGVREKHYKHNGK